MKKIVLTAILMQVISLSVVAQLKTNASILDLTARDQREKEIRSFELALKLAKEKGWELSIPAKNGNLARLVGVDDFGFPIYYTTQNNVIAATTTSANVLWPGGSSGLNLDGSPLNLKDKMAIWDGGGVLGTHVELNGRTLQKDAPQDGTSDHSTHVAGTMIASGVNPLAKGMAFGSQRILAYDFYNDASEMSSEASGLLLSNHSYGTIAGWYFNGGQNRWEFWGRPDDNEDYKFGWYNTQAQMYDSIAYNAPYYLIVKSSGNNRNENGPAVGENYWRLNASGVAFNAGPRPGGLSSNDGYDIISTYGTAKNILTVGAINGLPYGYSKKEDAVISSFSSWGPTDDGRIKPDVVADGVNVLSSIAASNTAYASYSGTSMATPNTTGSLLLLQQYYSQLHSGAFMRSATLKALAIHTADEAGTDPGPDYKFGWGVVNVGKAAQVIKANNTGNYLMQENVLNAGGSFTMNVVASGQGPLVATIVWTDPKGSVDQVNNLNNPAKKLVNDLDIRITKGSTTYQPWTLNPFVPTAAAVAGDNVLDNVERIDVEDVIPGQSYTITITHKGALARGSQAYSLIVSGIGGQAICASAPLSSAGGRIDNLSFGSINKTNPAGCSSYSNFTDLSARVEPGQILPINIKVNSCDATNNPKIVKVFIDYNSNGNFTDAGELAATSGPLSNEATFTGNIGIPLSVTPGNTSIMRVIVSETSDATTISPCTSYANGETQDYRIIYKDASNDISALELVAPANGACANPSQLVTVRIRNVGSVSKSNIPVSVLVKNGTTTVANLTANYQPTIAASDIATYTFQTPFAAAAGTTYTVELVTRDGSDQNSSNDTLRSTVTIAANATAPSGAAEICGTQAMLRVTNPTNANYFWYSTATDNSAIAVGATTTTSVIPTGNTYYVATGAKGTAGPANNAVWGNGGGYLSGSANYMKYSATVPVILETAKLYTKTAGKIDFIVADIISTTATGYTYQAISTTTIDVYSTSPNPASGTQAGFDPADNGADFYLNLLLPAGDHAIIVRPVGDANLFRNNNVTGSPYPFTLANVISFTGNSATSATDVNYFQGFYYYLYNMKVKTLDCVSGRTAILAPVAPTPVISQVNDSLASSVDAGNQWYRDGSGIVGANDKKYKPTQSGSYTVMVTDDFGCQRMSAAFNFIVNAINPVDNASVGLNISPNPNKGSFVLKFKAANRDDLRMEIINVQGQVVQSSFYPGITGSFTQTINTGVLASGIYVLKLQHGTKTYYTKMMIER